MDTVSERPLRGGAGHTGHAETSTRDVDALVVALFQVEGLRLVSLARLFVDDRTAAEDLVQEAFIRLARSAHRIRDEERAAAYLRSIVINLARDHDRRGLVSFRHRPPPVTDEPSAEDHAEASAARRRSWRPSALSRAVSGMQWRCATTSTCRFRRSPKPSRCPSTR